MAQNLIGVTQNELARVVREQVDAALSEHSGKPVLLDRTGLAQALSCSQSHIDVLRKRGLPTVWVGDAPRFELVSVVAWLKDHAERD